MIDNVKNVRGVLDQADATDIDEGRVSYFRYHEVLRDLAAYYGYSLPEVVAVFAALSPNSDYQSNLRSCVSVLRGYREGVDVNLIRVSTYNACRDRAYSYLSGVSFMETVSGKKIKSFYQNILNPLDPHPITIDGHAVNIWRGERVNLRQVASSHFNYDRIAEDYREVAKAVGLLPHQLQAITWFTWKRIHNIYYTGRQLELFRDVSLDLWQTVRRPDEIEPYPYNETPSYTTSRTQSKSLRNIL